MLVVKRKSDDNNLPETSAGSLPRQIGSSPGETASSRKGHALGRPKAAQAIEKQFQAKVPVITGEAHYRGLIAVDGVLSGQLGTNSGCFSVKQKPNAAFGSEPEMEGELNFRDMVRVNGHIAGSVFSPKGTLIVDVGARVDAHIDVGVALINGTVNGDIVAHDRVEIGPGAKIHGNIWTRSITIKGGAIFDGVCKIIEEPDERPS